MPTSADDEDGGDDVGDRQVVPLVPDEVADARSANQHLGRDDDQPGDADGDAHAGDDHRRRGGEDDGERLAPGETSSVRATFSHSLRTLATPKAVLISIGQMEQMKMTKMAEAPESLMV